MQHILYVVQWELFSRTHKTHQNAQWDEYSDTELCGVLDRKFSNRNGVTTVVEFLVDCEIFSVKCQLYVDIPMPRVEVIWRLW